MKIWKSQIVPTSLFLRYSIRDFLFLYVLYENAEGKLFEG